MICPLYFLANPFAKCILCFGIGLSPTDTVQFLIFLGGVPEGSHTSTISVFRSSVHPSVRPSVTGICYRKYLHVSVTENTALLCYRNYCLALLQKIPTLTCYRNLYSHHKNPVTDRWTNPLKSTKTRDNPSTPLPSHRGILSIPGPKHLFKFDTMNLHLHLVRCPYVNNKTRREIRATPEASYNDLNPPQGTMNGRGH